MFRSLRLSPPHGWRAVIWELGIVTLGVLIALAAQQWAEGRSLRGKVDATKSALREELGEHYSYAVEFRAVYPCMQAQLERLRTRVLTSEETLAPALTYKDFSDEYVFRKPTKFYPNNAWQEAISDGVVQRFEPATRRQLAGHYAALVTLQHSNSSNNDMEEELMVLAHPLPLDPSTRYAIIRTIEQLSGRLQHLDLMNGQVIDYIQRLGMVPPAEEARRVTERYGTSAFCKSQRLPMRSIKDAMVAVPN